MAIRINEDGAVYYTCPRCGRDAVIDPMGIMICTDRRCRHGEPIRDTDAFIETHNKTVQALEAIPRVIQNACYQYVGKPNDVTTSAMLQRTIEYNIRNLVNRGFIDNYELEFRRDGSVQCDFVLPAVARTMKIEFGID